MLGTKKEKSLFLARIIDHDKKGRLQLSSRESLTDQAAYTKSGFEDTNSATFQSVDEPNQKEGNMRNKILKFGA